MYLLIFNQRLRDRWVAMRNLLRGQRRGLRTSVLQLALLLGLPSLAPAQEAVAKSCLERPEICGSSASCCEQYELAEKHQKTINDSSLRKDPERRAQVIKNALAKYNAAFAIAPTATIKLKIARMYFFGDDEKQYKKSCDEAAELLEKLRKDDDSYKRLKKVLDEYRKLIRPELAAQEPISSELRTSPQKTATVDALRSPLPILVSPSPEKPNTRRPIGVWAGFGIGASITLSVTLTGIAGFVLAKQHEYNSTLQGTM